MTAPQSKKDIKTGVQKPPVCKVDLESIPEVLKQFPRWVFWKWVRKKGEWTKVPFNAYTGKKARPNDPSTWATWEQLHKVIKRPSTWKPCGRDFDGIGFFFHEEDRFCGTDLDDAIDTATGKLKPWAQKIVDTLDSYTEVSPSGTGVKIIAAGKKPGTRCKKNLLDGEVEMYDNARYFCLTGKHSAGTPQTIEDRTKEIALVYDDVFGKTPDKKKQKEKKESQPKTLRFETPTLSDTEIIERASAARNGYKFARLMNGDTSDYGGDHSRADAAFCTMLAFWCDRDAGQMDRIFRASGLMRAKWDERRGSKTYGERTLDQACSIAQETFRDYQKKKKLSGPVSESTMEEMIEAALALERSYRTAEFCYSLFHKMRKSIEDGHYEDWTLRCGCSHCPGCLARNKRLTAEKLRHFAAAATLTLGQKLYKIAGKAADWPAIHKEIDRCGAKDPKGCAHAKFRLSEEGDFAALTTANVRGSIELTLEEAEKFITDNIEKSVAGGRGKQFVSTSRNWKNIKEKKTARFTDVGKGTIKRTVGELIKYAKNFGTRRHAICPIDECRVEVGIFDPILDPKKAEEFEQWVQGFSVPSVPEDNKYITNDLDNDIPSDPSTWFQWVDNAWAEHVERVKLSG